MTTTDTVLAWHFRWLDGTTEYLREPEQVGKSYSCEGRLVLCGNGFHASEKVIDALTYAPGPLLCRVRCAGEILHGSDKLVCRTRTLLRSVDVTEQLRWFALECAEHIQHLSSDKRVSACNAVTRRYLNGKATVKKLNSARAAAEAAAGDAAEAAAGAAAEAAAGAAAGDAARAAARAAAGAAAGARAAARAAAGSAAGAAARAAARAAWAAAREWQRTALEARILPLFEE